MIRIVLTADNSKIVQLNGHTCPVKSVDYNPSGNYLISSDIKGNINIWDVSPSSPMPKCIKTLSESSYQSEIDSVLQSTVAFSPDETSFAFAGTNSDVRVFRSDIWAPSYNLDGQHTSSVITFAWSPNGYYLASSAEDNSFVVWDTKKRKSVVMETTSAQITGIAWNPNENEITLVS
jgi:WD40 repeat protein